MTTQFWSSCLLVSAVVAAVYAASLVVVGAVTGQLFDILGFGMESGAVPDGRPRAHVLFIYGVLGSVLIGWMTMVAAVAIGPLRSGRLWAWRALVTSIGGWFAVDTTFSLVIGEWEHAAFNVAFAVALGGPVVGWRRAYGRSTLAVAAPPE